MLVGLRGPVLRGWAVVLELRLRDVPHRPDGLAIRAFRKYFLHLGGLGVRDLCRDGDDVVLLAGPTMDIDGPVRLYRWRGAVRERKSSLVRGGQLTPLDVELPLWLDGDDPQEGRDHAEGITAVPDTEGRSLLVVYDSPGDARRRKDDEAVLADVVPLTR